MHMCAQMSQGTQEEMQIYKNSIVEKALTYILIWNATWNTWLFNVLSFMAAEIKFSTLQLSFVVKVLFFFKRSLTPLAIQCCCLHKIAKASIVFFVFVYPEHLYSGILYIR